jgi:NAD(P)H-nitrite reductase large subunit
LHCAEALVRFLANIQRNGTFSVVPRIPGGEIHPDKLVAIGKIAKEYGLYTKITGGTFLCLTHRPSPLEGDGPSC